MQGGLTVDSAQVERFRTDLAVVLPEGLRPGEPLALAVSGGGDSVAMLALAAAALPGQVTAATVDHGIRPEAAAEAATVATTCAGLGVPHATLTLDRPIAAGNLQAEARAGRYAVLGRWAVQAGARVLTTAHQADDQAETFLARAVRGAGPAGLAGVRPRRETEVTFATARAGVSEVYALAIVRPLLGWRRAELRAIADAAGLLVADDPSNADHRFERTRVRRLLAQTPWLDVNGLARAARHAAEADLDLRAIARWLWSDRRRAPDDAESTYEVWLDAATLPQSAQRLLARMAIEEVRDVNGIGRPSFSDATNVEALLRALNRGSAATLGGVMAGVERGLWRFRTEPPRRTG